ncbi:hypothetical protein F895_02546 [Acinetobacter sp. CIP 64.2]|uniref:DUF5713 family protein n=1 Tax=unclassified Acinetobacter TaxID=196816 RepID=UPI000288F339|nr:MULTISPECIES: DUF5713 family protein [unclassified Acinetobacter]ENX13245.1 hypothetical protein F895_02546 [Acinetobacter sp. CIP 64.2]
MQLGNQKMANYSFLVDMYADSYFPNDLVKKGERILISLCQQIELTQPKTLAELYKLTHVATEQFNELQEEFWEQESEIETAAREAIGHDFDVIAAAYGFENADKEEIIATRDW